MEKSKKKSFVFDPNKPPLYKIERIPGGFTIFREGLINAKISVNKNEIDIKTFREGLSREDKYINYGSVPILNYVFFKSMIVGEVFNNWSEKRTQKLAAQGKVSYKCNTSKKLKEWVLAKFSSGLTYCLYPEWLNLIQEIDPNVLAIHKKFFVVRGPKVPVPKIFSNLEIYENKAFVNDLLTYNSIHLCLDKSELKDGSIIFNFKEDMGYGDGATLKTSTNWRNLFSDLPNTYKSLNKTLDNWPRGVPVELAKKINKTHLSEPIYDRVKLIAFLLTSQNNSWKTTRIDHSDCVIRSSPEQIRKAFKLFKKNYESKHKRKCEFTLRGFKGIGHFVSYIGDYPEVHTGEIVGLLEKSHRWHQDEDLRRQAADELRRIENERRRAEDAIEREAEKKMSTKLPPIPLPESDSIRFLKTAEEVIAEGTDMGHCIATYVRSSIKGECFLFHVEYSEEKASIMVDKDGRVVQSYGPRNCVNKASEWATNQLNGWGRKLAKHFMEEEAAKIKETLSDNRALVGI